MIPMDKDNNNNNNNKCSAKREREREIGLLDRRVSTSKNNNNIINVHLSKDSTFELLMAADVALSIEQQANAARYLAKLNSTELN